MVHHSVQQHVQSSKQELASQAISSVGLGATKYLSKPHHHPKVAASFIPRTRILPVTRFICTVFGLGLLSLNQALGGYDWIGPFRIVSAIDQVVYRIENQKGKQQVVHVDRLKSSRQNITFVLSNSAVSIGDVAISTPITPSVSEYDPSLLYDEDLSIPQPHYAFRSRHTTQIPHRYR